MGVAKVQERKRGVEKSCWTFKERGLTVRRAAWSEAWD